MAESSVTVLCIGTGIIGGAAAAALRAHGDGIRVITASRSSGDLQVDVSSAESILALDKELPASSVDHVVVTCGWSTFGPLASFDALDKWDVNLQGKLGAVTRLCLMMIHNTVHFLRDGGSITVTTGMSAETLNHMWPGLAVNNAGLYAFVRNGGIKCPRSLRLNSVSPALVMETAKKAGLPLEGTVPAATVGAAYVPLVFGDMSGQITSVGQQVAFKSAAQGGTAAGGEGEEAGPSATETADVAQERFVTAALHLLEEAAQGDAEKEASCLAALLQRLPPALKQQVGLSAEAAAAVA